MFDATAEIVLELHLDSGVHAINMRWPTDEEWAKYIRSRKVIRRTLGRGVTHNLPVEPSEADVALCQKIMLNGAPPLNKAEAFLVMETISQCNAIGIEIEGDWATVELSIMRDTIVKHRLRIPTASQMVKFNRVGFRLLYLPFNQSQIQLLIEPATQLWSECQGSSEDYVDGVIPANHKDTAIRVLIHHIDQNLGPQRGDENF